MKKIDDYELMDKDFDEFIRRGREELEWEARQQKRRDTYVEYRGKIAIRTT